MKASGSKRADDAHDAEDEDHEKDGLKCSSARKRQHGFH